MGANIIGKKPSAISETLFPPRISVSSHFVCFGFVDQILCFSLSIMEMTH